MTGIYIALFRFIFRRVSPWKLFTHDEMATFGREYEEGMRTHKHGFYETWVGAWSVMTKRFPSRLRAAAQGVGR